MLSEGLKHGTGRSSHNLRYFDQGKVGGPMTLLQAPATRPGDACQEITCLCHCNMRLARRGEDDALQVTAADPDPRRTNRPHLLR